VEVLLTRQVSPLQWEALVRPSRRLQPGTRLIVKEGVFECTILERSPLGGRLIELHYEGDIWDILGTYGITPLPPYIKKTLEDDERYQTVYAHERGSVAAPTAGLHFTPELLERLKCRGIDHAFVTLHIGPGTFRQVKCDRVEEHVMDQEYYSLSRETLRKVMEAKKKGIPVIAVGTTSVRTLESVFAVGMEPGSLSGDTGLFIYPGYTFKIVDRLITNFHLPRSTLLMLVSAFGGGDLVKRAYHEAVHNRYRFYSLGDAMLIL
jgi:S-adenosylmethionine:tRNA ribosyltransferase-isomerase